MIHIKFDENCKMAEGLLCMNGYSFIHDLVNML